MTKKIIILLLCICGYQGLLAQNFTKTFTVPVLKGGDTLDFAWVGGINIAQFSDIDLDQDGDLDLFLYDREANRILTFENKNVANTISYVYTEEYNAIFPTFDEKGFVLLRDFNCDGKMDIFTSTSLGIRVYENTSTIALGLQFTLKIPYLESEFIFGTLNLATNNFDVPAIDDIDGDGDLDILTFGSSSSQVEYHKNLSMELKGTCGIDTTFEVKNYCWGYFSEGNSTNNINLNDTCSPNVANPEIKGDALEKTSTVHEGSTLLTLDLNGDSVQDLLLGDISFKNLIALLNMGGKSSSNIGQLDTAFPSNTQAIDADLYPAAFYHDINNDGLKDLLVSSNDPGNATNKHNNIWLYTNSGANNNPVFNFSKRNFLQDEMIEHSEMSTPVLFDYNNDGLLDILIGNLGYFSSTSDPISGFALYENTGVGGNASFQHISDDYMNLSQFNFGTQLHATFGDLDGDGDDDMLIGNLEGKLRVVFNHAGANNIPLFDGNNSVVLKDNNNTIIDVGISSKPTIVDLNRDGLLDIVVGERNGNLNYYQHFGHIQQFNFGLVTDSLGGIRIKKSFGITGYTVPYFFEVDSVYQLLLGNELGTVFWYNAIENNLNGAFNLIDSNATNNTEYSRCAPAIGNLDGDSLYEMVVGNYRGGLSYYESDIVIKRKPKLVSIHDRDQQKTIINIYPNPASDFLDITLYPAQHNKYKIQLLSLDGKVVLQSEMMDKKKLNISMLSNGYYFLTLYSNSVRITTPFIKVSAK